MIDVVLGFCLTVSDDQFRYLPSTIGTRASVALSNRFEGLWDRFPLHSTRSWCFSWTEGICCSNAPQTIHWLTRELTTRPIKASPAGLRNFTGPTNQSPSRISRGLQVNPTSVVSRFSRSPVWAVFKINNSPLIAFFKAMSALIRHQYR